MNVEYPLQNEFCKFDTDMQQNAVTYMPTYH